MPTPLLRRTFILLGAALIAALLASCATPTRAPLVLDFAADEQPQLGEGVTIRWTVPDIYGTVVTLEPGFGEVEPSGERTVAPEQATTYVLTVTRGSDVATREIDVEAVNAPPAATAAGHTTPEDTALTVPLVGVDADDDALTFAIVDAPAHGALSPIDPVTGEVVYTPAADWHGEDAFTFTAHDALGASEPATVTITVTPVDDGPWGRAMSRSTPEDTALELTLDGGPGDLGVATFAIVDAPAHGKLSGFDADTGAVTYTPDAHYAGSDAFTFTVSDGTLTTEATTVELTVGPVNDAPVAGDVAAATDEDVAVTVTLAASDTEKDALVFEIVDAPAHGALSDFDAAAGTVTYTPGADWHGDASFTFRAADATDTSNVATATVTVAPVDDAPVADDGAASGDEDTAVAITLTGSDVEGDDLAFALGTAPAHGTLSKVDPTTGDVTYTPDADWSGEDTFGFAVSDGETTSAEATVTVTISPVNDAPTVTITSPADGSSYLLDRDVPLAASASDAEDGDLSAQVRWSSDLDGDLGTGEALDVRLSEGTHTLIATVVDAGGADASADVTIIVKSGFVDSGQTLGSEWNWDAEFGDLDGDGDLDAWVARDSTQSGSLVFFNDGTGVFTDSGQTLGSDYATNVALGDLDRDGDLDAFVASRYGGSTSASSRVWFNDGHGVFTDSGQRLGTGNDFDVALGDLDGDGDLDAYLVNEHGSNGDRVLLNDGHGVFTDSGQRLGDGYARAVLLGDLDGDGDLDAWSGGGYGYTSTSGERVWFNDGTGTFTDSGQSFGTTNEIYGGALGDVDGDGDLDLFVPLFGGGGVLRLNDGNGTFTDSGQSFTTDGYGLDGALDDVDGDGDLDLWIAAYRDGNRFYLNDGSGVFTDSGQRLGTDASLGVDLGDVDGDGDLDAWAANSGVDRVYFFVQDTP